MLALDANILIRGVLGRRVCAILEAYIARARFVVPDAVVEEARSNVPRIALDLGLDPRSLLDTLEDLIDGLEVVELGRYRSREVEAKQRIGRRDMTDWPTVVVALLFNCPVWTEDPDFFGSGLAT